MRRARWRAWVFLRPGPGDRSLRQRIRRDRDDLGRDRRGQRPVLHQDADMGLLRLGYQAHLDARGAKSRASTLKRFCMSTAWLETMSRRSPTRSEAIPWILVASTVIALAGGNDCHQAGAGPLGQEVELGERIAGRLFVIDHATRDLAEVADHPHLPRHLGGWPPVSRP